MVQKPTQCEICTEWRGTLGRPLGSRQKERGRSFSGQNIYDICPSPEWAGLWARILPRHRERQEGLGLEALYLGTRQAGVREDGRTSDSAWGLRGCRVGDSDWTTISHGTEDRGSPTGSY